MDISETHIEMARKYVLSGTFLHGDVGSMAFPSGMFEAVVSCYTLEHIPRKEHQAILHRINQWLKNDGYLLLSIEAGEYEDEVGEWLGVPMFLSCYDPETMKQMVINAGFAIIQSDIEVQIEGGTAIPYLWILGRKTQLRSTETSIITHKYLAQKNRTMCSGSGSRFQTLSAPRNPLAA